MMLGLCQVIPGRVSVVPARSRVSTPSSLQDQINGHLEIMQRWFRKKYYDGTRPPAHSKVLLKSW